LCDFSIRLSALKRLTGFAAGVVSVGSGDAFLLAFVGVIAFLEAELSYKGNVKLG